MLHVAAQMLREIMQRRARRADGGGAVFQPETVERRHFEMVAHGVKRRFRRKGPVVVTVENLVELTIRAEQIAAIAHAASPG